MTVAGFLVCAAQASAGMRTLDRMMVDLASDSAHAAETIRRVYHDHLDVLTLREYAELAGALDNGGLVPLPPQSLRYNIIPRLDGPHPIGEMDLANQRSYISARASTIGALLAIASRVKSGPLEITSLVRHGDYQESLRSTNPNANTSVPMHTMGLAVDIALVNTPLNTIYEIRDVLQTMQDAGEILFIGERKQLVFHVVPHPSRLGHFNEVYARAVGEPLTSRSAGVVAFLEAPRLLPAALTPEVTTEIVAVLPAEGPLQNLWIEEAPVEESSTPPVAWGDRWLPLVMACAVGLLLIPRGRPNRRPLLETTPVRMAGRVLLNAGPDSSTTKLTKNTKDHPLRRGEFSRVKVIG
jgi:hypothetical protein